MKKYRSNVYMDLSLWEKIKKRAESEGRTVSNMIAHIVEQFFKGKEK